MQKQDMQPVRTAADLERKHNFGKRFSEVFGLANDARKEAADAKKAVADLDRSLTAEEVFNRLTGNGQAQGVYRDTSGEIYINASYIKTGEFLVKDGGGYVLFKAGNGAVKIAGWTVDDNSIHHGSLGGDNSMWLCRTGTTTAGSIGGSARQSNWCIAVGKQFGVTKTGTAYASDLHIKGGSVSIANTGLDGGKTVIDASGLVLASEDYTEPGTGTYMRFSTNHIQHYDDTFGATPMIYVGYDADEGSLVKRLEGLWQVDSWESPVQVSSDRNVKYDIQDQPQVYSQIFDKLRPVTFRYKNGTSGRTHTGFIAQDVEDAVLSVGLTTQEFAGVCYDLDENGSKTNYGVRYEEIVSMLVWEVQKLKEKMK